MNTESGSREDRKSVAFVERDVPNL